MSPEPRSELSDNFADVATAGDRAEDGRAVIVADEPVGVGIDGLAVAIEPFVARRRPPGRARR